MRIYKTTDPAPTSTIDREHIYNAGDVMITMEVFEELQKQFDEVTWKVYELERSLQGPVLEMDLRGVLVDITARDDLIKELSNDVLFLEESLEEILSEGIGTSIKPTSP